MQIDSNYMSVQIPHESQQSNTLYRVGSATPQVQIESMGTLSFENQNQQYYFKYLDDKAYWGQFNKTPLSRLNKIRESVISDA